MKNFILFTLNFPFRLRIARAATPSQDIIGLGLIELIQKGYLQAPHFGNESATEYLDNYLI